jgi:hypothetical protein
MHALVVAVAVTAPAAAQPPRADLYLGPLVEVAFVPRENPVPLGGVRFDWRPASPLALDVSVTTALLVTSFQVGAELRLGPFGTRPYVYGRAGFMAVTIPDLCETDDCLQPAVRLDAGGGLHLVERPRWGWFLEGGILTIQEAQADLHVAGRAATGVRFGLR